MSDRLNHETDASPAGHGMVAAARYYHARNYAEAERCCLELIASDERHFDALHLLGVVYLDRARHPDAVGYLTRAAHQRADDPKVQYHLGTALLGLKSVRAGGTGVAASACSATA